MHGLNELLSALSMDASKTPELWIYDWENAASAYPAGGPDFLKETYIRECNKYLRLDEDKINVFYSGAASLSSRESLKQLAWLWYYTLFHGSRKDALRWGEINAWPFPPDMPKPLRGAFAGLVMLGAFPSMQRFYKDKGIPEEILIHTLSDVDVKMDEYFRKEGHYGIGMYVNWLQFHFKSKLFALGRLQYICSRCGEEYGIYKNNKTGGVKSVHSPETNADKLDNRETDAHNWDLIFKQGDLRLEVHIPRNGRSFSPEACGDSYAKAHAFYKKYFPELDYKAFTCDSWLLSPCLKEILPPGSNIVQFQSEFTICRESSYEGWQEYVFDGRTTEKPASEWPEGTSLQRAVKKHVLKGGHIYSAFGVKIF